MSEWSGQPLSGCPRPRRDTANVRIAEIMLKEVVERISRKGIIREVTEKFKYRLVEEGYNPSYGARPLRRAIMRLLEESLAEKRDEIFSKLEVGAIMEGRVKNITDFGVFIDLGGIDGLLHITDLSWGRINHPSEIISMEETLTVKVIDFDNEKKRVSLGLKQLTPHPWETVETDFPQGEKVKGKVVSMTNYGAFVEIKSGIEGLIHVSEMSWTRHVKNPSELYALGDEVEAVVLSIDTEERKISLGAKQLSDDP